MKLNKLSSAITVAGLSCALSLHADDNERSFAVVVTDANYEMSEVVFGMHSLNSDNEYTVGQSYRLSPRGNAFRTLEGGRVEHLPIENSSSAAYVINEHGTSSGFSCNDICETFIWKASGEVITAQAPSGYRLIPAGLSNSGLVVGNDVYDDGYLMTDLGEVLPLKVLKEGQRANAGGVNNQNIIAGSIREISAAPILALWDEAGELLHFEPIEDAFLLEVSHITDDLEVLGKMTGPEGHRPFQWTQENGFEFLNTAVGIGTAKTTQRNKDFSAGLIQNIEINGSDPAPALWNREGDLIVLQHYLVDQGIIPDAVITLGDENVIHFLGETFGSAHEGPYAAIRAQIASFGQCYETDSRFDDHEIWNSKQTYHGGEIVHKDFLVWRAKWWNQDSMPAVSNEAWELVSDVVTTWNQSGTYMENMQVRHDGQVWQAQWWTSGDQPGSSNAWALVSEDKCA